MQISTNQIIVVVIVITIIFLAASFFLVLYVNVYNKRKRKLLGENKVMQIEFQQALLQTQIEIQEQTLKTISQEIHDNIGQVLSLAKLNLNTFEDVESSTNQTKINDTKQLVSKAIIDLRNLSRSMYGDQLHDLGLTDAIKNELTILQNTGQYKTAIEVKGESFKMPGQKEMIVFRMVQEAINNSIKHAKARNMTVLINYSDNNFFLSIEDDGQGFDKDVLPIATNGMGLKSMQSRAALIGGTCRIDSALEKGTRISFELKNANNNR